MATQSGILAWKIPWTEEPDGLRSIGLQRTGDRAAGGQVPTVGSPLRRVTVQLLRTLAGTKGSSKT